MCSILQCAITTLLSAYSFSPHDSTCPKHLLFYWGLKWSKLWLFLENLKVYITLINKLISLSKSDWTTVLFRKEFLFRIYFCLSPWQPLNYFLKCDALTVLSQVSTRVVKFVFCNVFLPPKDIWEVF